METMTSSVNKKFTPSQQAKFNRHKAIRTMEKMMKNMYRMFRDETITLEQVSKRFFELKEQLEDLGRVPLDTEYYREMRKYIEKLSSTLMTQVDIDTIRGTNMTQLNRIQKIKNKTDYKREKRL